MEFKITMSVLLFELNFKKSEMNFQKFKNPIELQCLRLKLMLIFFRLQSAILTHCTQTLKSRESCDMSHII